ncbi:MAG: PKD domain-containing protein [Chloroflexota bacterium]|nr:MAG: PKD domain-containing protein [Chloroflexota bacterium]
MNRYRMVLKVFLVMACSLILVAVMTGSAAAETDTYLGVAFHPFTLDGGNGTCIDYDDVDVGQTKNCDPVNLVFPGRTWAEVRDVLLADGWSTCCEGSHQWLHYDDGAGLYIENEQLVKPGTIFGPRYHIRLWQAPATLLTFAAVHHEDFIHNIDMHWEDAEAYVANALCGPDCEQTGPLTTQISIQGDDNTWRPEGIDNLLNNGSATVIPAPGPPDDSPAVTIIQPAAGSTISGVTPVVIQATDDNDPAGTLDVEWRIDDGGWSPATYNGDSGYYEASWNPAGVPNGDHLFQAQATDSVENTAGTNHSVTVAVAPASTLHVGDIEGASSSVKRNWQAEVTITIHDDGDGLVLDATVSGRWSGDASGTGDCTIVSGGACTITSGPMSKKDTNLAIFTVTAVEHPTLAYEAAANHDPEGNSSGTAIQVNKDGSTQNPGEPPPSPPVASFTYDCPDLTCSFDAAGSYDPDGGDIVAYAWDFGDDGTATGQNASHTFAAGTHQVTLTVTDDEGLTDDVMQEVSVGGGSALSLAAAGYKVKGVHHTDLSWSGASSSHLDIYRDGELLTTTPAPWPSGTMPYTDNTGQKGGATYLYRICEAGSTAVCSEEVSVTF